MLCKFIELPGNNAIFINPALVEYVKPAASGTGAFVYFAKEHLVWVELSAERVAQALDNAQRPVPQK
jgi:hypothetical protein